FEQQEVVLAFRHKSLELPPHVLVRRRRNPLLTQRLAGERDREPVVDAGGGRAGERALKLQQPQVDVPLEPACRGTVHRLEVVDRFGLAREVDRQIGMELNRTRHRWLLMNEVSRHTTATGFSTRRQRESNAATVRTT